MIQVVFEAVGRLAPFPTTALRHRAVRTVAFVCSDALLAQCVVDEHAHLLMRGPEAVKRAHQARRALQVFAAVPLAEPFVKPIESRRHLENMVSYIHTQPTHHGLRGHPALWVGSSFVDLIGARKLPGFDPTLLAEELPRRPGLAWESVGLQPCSPATDRALEEHGALAIARAASRAVGFDTLSSSTRPEREARGAVASLLRRLGYHGGQIAAALEIPPSTARRLAHTPPSPLESTIRMQIALQDLVVEEALRRFRAA